MTDRFTELATALAEVRARIATACAEVDRDPNDVLLLPVTKNFPATDVELLIRLGITEFAENRHQEAHAKIAALAGLTDVRPRWHMVGGLQRNKARAVLGWADVVQSVADLRLVAPLSAAASARGGPPVDILLQLSLDGDPTRAGAVEKDLPALAEAVVAAPGLRLAGLMAVAPRGAAPDVAFHTLRRNLAAVRVVDPHATVMSAGMSGDLADAIRNGSTCVRVGTAVLGGRRLASPESR